MKTKLSLILASLAMAFSVGAGVAATNKDITNVDAAIDINDYTACNTAYNNNNASGLLSALRTITSPGSSGSYDALWETYKKAYVRSDGKIFDYYSSITNYVPGGSAEGANYSKEGDSYNREHSIPKSWWGGSKTNQGADPYIVVPTDGYVNNGRSNYSFGKVKTVTTAYSNSKLGTGDSAYISGTVFEPDDSVKGDFARIMFYAIAKYSNSYSWTSGDGSKNFSGNANTNFGLTTNAVKLFSYWSNLDPVSEWEQSVNNKVSAIQGNRNPFIDHPEYANVLWGTVSGYTTYSGTVSGSVEITKTNVKLAPSGTSEVSATSSNNSNISWSSDNTSVATVSSAQTASGAIVTITGVAEGSATITASATINNVVYSKTCAVKVQSSGGSGGTGTYTFDCTGQDTPLTNSASKVEWEYDGVSLSINQSESTTAANNYVGGDGDKDHTRVYKNQTFVIDAGDNSISYVTVQSDSKNCSGFTGGSWTNATCSNESGVLTLTPTNSNISTITGTISATSKFYTVTIVLQSAATIELSSIEISQEPEKTEYRVGEYFDPTDLLIKATYSNNSTSYVFYNNNSSSFSFNPSLSTALKTTDTTVTISYTENNITKSANLSITVSQPRTLSSIAVTGATTAYSIGDSFAKPAVTATFSDSSTEDVSSSCTFTGYDLSVAGNQTVTVSFTYSGVTKTTSYSITVSTVPVSSVSLNKSSASVYVGGQLTLTATVSPTNATNKNIAWTSSNTNYATVQDGIVTGVAKGTATITASSTTDSSKKATCTITVEESTSGWSLVTNASSLKAGDQLLLASNTKGVVNGVISSQVFSEATDAVFSSDKTKMTTVPDDAVILTLGGSAGAWTFTNSSNQVLGVTAVKKLAWNSGTTTFTISISNSNATIQSTTSSYGRFLHNVDVNRFTTYTSNTSDTMLLPQLYRNEAAQLIPSSITATAKRVFYVGETITKSDIKVMTNTGVDVTNDVTFGDYQFTYQDALSDGQTTSNSFDISYNNLDCEMNVSVQRKAYSSPTGAVSDSFNGNSLIGDLTGYRQFKDKQDSSSAKYSGVAINNQNVIGLRTDGNEAGIVMTETGGVVTSVQVTSVTGTVNIYGKNTPYSSSADLFNANKQGSLLGSVSSGSTSLSISGTFRYIGVRSSSGAVSFGTIQFNINNIDYSKTLADYVMFSDTEGQCESKFSVASTIFNNIGRDERVAFMSTSDDYCVVQARARFIDWAKHHGKVINQSGGDYVISGSQNLSLVRDTLGGSATTIIIIIGVIGLSALGGYIFIRKRKES